jgi:hypothetical protein
MRPSMRRSSSGVGDAAGNDSSDSPSVVQTTQAAVWVEITS